MPKRHAAQRSCCFQSKRLEQLGERIEEVGYDAGLFVCHGRMTGNGQFLGMNLLGDGEREVIPLSVALLLVGRNRIVNLCLHAVVGKEGFQFITTR